MDRKRSGPPPTETMWLKKILKRTCFSTSVFKILELLYILYFICTYKQYAYSYVSHPHDENKHIQRFFFMHNAVCTKFKLIFIDWVEEKSYIIEMSMKYDVCSTPSMKICWNFNFSELFLTFLILPIFFFINITILHQDTVYVNYCMLICI